jgi:pyruvate formate lyase activating enzyme
MTHDDLCLGCGRCVEVCPEKAITLGPETGRTIDRQRCSRCFKCVEVCPAQALTAVGETMSIDQVMAEIVKDELFMVRSGGGVTVSGGEPLLQGAFVTELLKACQEHGLHTALDTCGQAPWPILEAALAHTDLVLYDIKHMNPKAHLQATGIDNSLALANLRKIPKHINLWLRIPLIPGFSDSTDNLDQIIFLSREIAPEKISILPYHKYGDGKYVNLGLEAPFAEVKTFQKEQLDKIKAYLETSGLPVTVGE